MRIGYRSWTVHTHLGHLGSMSRSFRFSLEVPGHVLSFHVRHMRRQCDDKGYILSGRNHGRCGLDRLRNCKALASRHPILFPDVSLHFSWILLVILVYSSDLSPCFNSSTTVKHIWNTYETHVVHMLCTCRVSPRSEAHFLLRTLPPQARCECSVSGWRRWRRVVPRGSAGGDLEQLGGAVSQKALFNPFNRFHQISSFWSVKHGKTWKTCNLRKEHVLHGQHG